MENLLRNNRFTVPPPVAYRDFCSVRERERASAIEHGAHRVGQFLDRRPPVGCLSVMRCAYSRCCRAPAARDLVRQRRFAGGTPQRRCSQPLATTRERQRNREGENCRFGRSAVRRITTLRSAPRRAQLRMKSSASCVAARRRRSPLHAHHSASALQSRFPPPPPQPALRRRHRAPRNAGRFPNEKGRRIPAAFPFSNLEGQVLSAARTSPNSSQVSPLKR